MPARSCSPIVRPLSSSISAATPVRATASVSPVHDRRRDDRARIENEIYYSEKVLRIACNQPIDRKRQIAAQPTRAQASLPEDAFVYACFNSMQKTSEACFARWMTILQATPGGVSGCWLPTTP